jgi:hypothetical protein
MTHAFFCVTSGTLSVSAERTTQASPKAFTARVRSIEAEARLSLSEMKVVMVEEQRSLEERGRAGRVVVSGEQGLCRVAAAFTAHV